MTQVIASLVPRLLPSILLHNLKEMGRESGWFDHVCNDVLRVFLCTVFGNQIITHTHRFRAFNYARDRVAVTVPDAAQDDRNEGLFNASLVTVVASQCFPYGKQSMCTQVQPTLILLEYHRSPEGNPLGLL